ncbi:MAG: hypothetical protein E4H33_04105 [Anaerolineales bacterium]|nr:MAG: hypothetical protein E4H33_04105 [Anaerolineales bacterium]
MKTTKHQLILFLILTLPILFLTACSDLSDADWELLEVAFESWAEENGLLENDQWQPDGLVIKAVEKTIDDFNNQKEFVELDGLDVVRDIENADQLAGEAMNQNDIQKMQAAVDLRPKDWRLQEQNAVLLSFNNKEDSSIVAFENANNSIEERIKQGGDCVALRTQQLEYREQLLSDQINTCSKILNCDDSLLVFDMQFTQMNLFSIYETGSNAFCETIE